MNEFYVTRGHHEARAWQFSDEEEVSFIQSARITQAGMPYLRDRDAGSFFCYNLFRKFTGIILVPGERKKVRLVVCK